MAPEITSRKPVILAVEDHSKTQTPLSILQRQQKPVHSTPTAARIPALESLKNPQVAKALEGLRLASMTDQASVRSVLKLLPSEFQNASLSELLNAERGHALFSAFERAIENLHEASDVSKLLSIKNGPYSRPVKGFASLALSCVLYSKAKKARHSATSNSAKPVRARRIVFRGSSSRRVEREQWFKKFMDCDSKTEREILSARAKAAKERVKLELGPEKEAQLALRMRAELMKEYSKAFASVLAVEKARIARRNNELSKGRVLKGEAQRIVAIDARFDDEARDTLGLAGVSNAVLERALVREENVLTQFERAVDLKIAEFVDSGTSLSYFGKLIAAEGLLLKPGSDGFLKRKLGALAWARTHRAFGIIQ